MLQYFSQDCLPYKEIYLKFWSPPIFITKFKPTGELLNCLIPAPPNVMCLLDGPVTSWMCTSDCFISRCVFPGHWSAQAQYDQASHEEVPGSVQPGAWQDLKWRVVVLSITFILLLTSKNPECENVACSTVFVTYGPSYPFPITSTKLCTRLNTRELVNCGSGHRGMLSSGSGEHNIPCLGHCVWEQKVRCFESAQLSISHS